MDIHPYRLDLFFIRETALQIIKDFDLFGIEISFSGNTDTAYEELKGQLQPVISELLTTDQSKVLSVLYRIDVMERNIKKAFLPEFKLKRSALLADLIIERELQKVVVRKLYSEKQKK